VQCWVVHPIDALLYDLIAVSMRHVLPVTVTLSSV